jgi:hypothetical protein
LLHDPETRVSIRSCVRTEAWSKIPIPIGRSGALNRVSVNLAHNFVMTGLVPVIHDLFPGEKDVDGRDKQ